MPFLALFLSKQCALAIALLICVSTQTTFHVYAETETTPRTRFATERIDEQLTLLPLSLDTSEPANVDFVYFKLSYTFHREARNLEPHVAYFPAPLHALLSGNTLRAFSASISQGQWKAEQWGAPLPLGERDYSGGDLSARISPLSNISESWSILSQTLGGLLCAGFSTVDTPSQLLYVDQLDSSAFRRNKTAISAPGSSAVCWGSDTDRVVSARIPSEVLCSENTAKLLALLPCRSQAGLATLVSDAVWMARLPFKALRLRAAHGERDSVSGTDHPFVEKAQLTLSGVVPLQTDAFPSLFQALYAPPNSGLQHTLASLVATTLFSKQSPAVLESCSAVDSSSIRISFPAHRPFRATEAPPEKQLPYPCTLTQRPTGGFLTTCTLKSHILLRHQKVLNPSTIQTELNHVSRPASPVECKTFLSVNEKASVERLQGSYGVMFINKDRYRSRKIWYFGFIPSIVDPLLHTLEADFAGHLLQGLDVFHALRLHWRYPVHDHHPIQYSFSAILPPTKELVFKFNFLKRFLLVGQFNFSAEEGLVLPGGLCLQTSKGSEMNSAYPYYGLQDWDMHEGLLFTSAPHSHAWLWSYTENHFTHYALPDLSMHFNIIALSTTVFMLVLGGLFKLTAVRYEKRTSQPLLRRFLTRK